MLVQKFLKYLNEQLSIVSQILFWNLTGVDIIGKKSRGARLPEKLKGYVGGRRVSGLSLPNCPGVVLAHGKPAIYLQKALVTLTSWMMLRRF